MVIAMGVVHNLLEARGKQGALEAGIERCVVEAAAQYLADEDNALGFAYTMRTAAQQAPQRFPLVHLRGTHPPNG